MVGRIRGTGADGAQPSVISSLPTPKSLVLHAGTSSGPAPSMSGDRGGRVVRAGFKLQKVEPLGGSPYVFVAPAG